MVLRLLVLKHIRNWSYEVLEREVRANLVYHDEPALGHQLRHFAGAANVLHAVGLGEAEVATQPMADVVAVEQHGVVAGGLRPPLDNIGDR